MEIQCSFASMTISPCNQKTMEVLLVDVRHDLVLDQIIQEKGVEFVLQAIGNEKAIAEFMQANGYTVFESSWKAA